MKAQQAALFKLRKDIAPYYVTVSIALMDSADGFTSGEAEDKFKDGIDFAKNHRLDRACELWGDAKSQSPHPPSLLYNLGLCVETAGRLEEALNLYTEADRALNKPDERITAALTRIKTAIEKQKALKEQLAK